MPKVYKCFKCGVEIETDDPEGIVYQIPTQNKKKHYYLCSSCHDEGGASEKDPCFETQKDIEELFEET
jgi:DNA-directed RNA polymerase subunit RPC12/RpoP